MLLGIKELELIDCSDGLAIQSNDERKSSTGFNESSKAETNAKRQQSYSDNTSLCCGGLINLKNGIVDTFRKIFCRGKKNN